jgi:hypothetical protein
MQDEIVSSLANMLEAQLFSVEARRAERSLHPDAMELCFQGWNQRNKGTTPEHIAQARGFFERALMLDPCSVEALGQRFLGSNHIRRRRRVCMTKCG